MTSEEITATIERLNKLGFTGLTGTQVSVSFMNCLSWQTPEFRDKLIELLEQADPDTHMELPRDADGVPWHVDDVIDQSTIFDKGCSLSPIDVVGVSETDVFFWRTSGDIECRKADELRHYHEPTVSEILDELEGLRGTGDYESVVMRAAELAGMLRELMADGDA